MSTSSTSSTSTNCSSTGWPEAFNELTAQQLYDLALEAADPAEGGKLLTAAAKKSHPLALAAIAELYQKGTEQFPQSSLLAAEAAGRCLDLATKGDKAAMYAVGCLISEGIGLPQDRKLGEKWMRLSGVECTIL